MCNVPGILLVSNDPDEGKVWQYALQQRGYNIQLATSTSQSLTVIAEPDHKLVIMDVFDPLERMIPTLKQLRTHTTVPILLLTSQKDEPHIVQAIEAGADDYLIKPMEIRLLLAKVRVWLSRTGTALPEPTSSLKIGDLHLCPCEQTVTVGDTPINLTNLEFRALNILMHHSGQVLSKATLVSRVWGYTDGDD